MSDDSAFRWALALKGGHIDVADATALCSQADPRIHQVPDREGAPLLVLTSPQLDTLDDPHQAEAVAERLLALVNGILFVRDRARDPLVADGIRERGPDFQE